MASNTTHASEVLGRKAISIKWPSSSTDHNRGFGPGVGSFEARIADFESCPQLPFGRKHPGAWAPNLGKFLCVILGEISVGELISRRVSRNRIFLPLQICAALNISG